MAKFTFSFSSFRSRRVKQLNQKWIRQTLINVRNLFLFPLQPKNFDFFSADEKWFFFHVSLKETKMKLITTQRSWEFRKKIFHAYFLFIVRRRSLFAASSEWFVHSRFTHKQFNSFFCLRFYRTSKTEMRTKAKKKHLKSIVLCHCLLARSSSHHQFKSVAFLPFFCLLRRFIDLSHSFCQWRATGFNKDFNGS